MWKYESYLQKGLFHIQNGSECQDSVLIRENKQCIAAALADGLGSLKYSEFAAQTVTQAVCDLFLESPQPKAFFENEKNNATLKSDLISSIRERLSAKADEMEISTDEMDCTLVFVCISKVYDRAIVGWLGDSAICVISSKGSVAINDSDKSATGTNAIQDSDAEERMEIFRYNIEKDGILGFILTSDGLDNELYIKGSSHVNKAAEKYFNAVSVDKTPGQAIASAIGVLTSYEGTPFDDDISLAVLSCTDKPVVFDSDPTWLCRCGTRNRIQDTYCKKCHQDFSVLYKNITFKEHGGKAAFFSKINADSGKELELLGIARIAKPTASDGSPADAHAQGRVIIQNPTPVVQNQAPVIQNPAPAVQNPAPGVQNPAPQVPPMQQPVPPMRGGPNNVPPPPPPPPKIPIVNKPTINTPNVNPANTNVRIKSDPARGKTAANTKTGIFSNKSRVLWIYIVGAVLVFLVFMMLGFFITKWIYNKNMIALNSKVDVNAANSVQAAAVPEEEVRGMPENEIFSHDPAEDVTEQTTMPEDRDQTEVISEKESKDLPAFKPGTIKEKANVRENPGPDNKRVTELMPGTKIMYDPSSIQTAGNYDWVRIKADDNVTGWVITVAIEGYE